MSKCNDSAMLNKTMWCRCCGSGFVLVQKNQDALDASVRKSLDEGSGRLTRDGRIVGVRCPVCGGICDYTG